MSVVELGAECRREEEKKRMLAENVSNQRFMACFRLFYFLQQSHRNQKMSGTTTHSIIQFNNYLGIHSDKHYKIMSH